MNTMHLQSLSVFSLRNQKAKQKCEHTNDHYLKENFF